MASRSVSQDFVRHVLEILDDALDYAVTGKGARRGINCFSRNALPAYILSTAAVEAYVNEAFLSHSGKPFYSKDAPLWRFSAEWIERLDLNIKVLLVPQLLFGTCPRRDAMPYQDFSLLVKIRNDLVHYKMSNEAPKYVKVLDDRGITIRRSGFERDGVDYNWLDKLSCTEGICWAHNTSCAMVADMIGIAPDERNPMYKMGRGNFQALDPGYVRDFLIEHHIDPDSNDPADTTPPPRSPDPTPSSS